MKPTENIEEFVRREKPHVTTGGTMDKQTLNDSFAAMDETVRANKPSVAGIIIRSRAAKLAAAAMIIMAVGLLMVYRNPPVQQQPPQTVSVAKSPAEMRSILSLNIAYRRGGIEAVDRQCQLAMGMLGPRPAEVTIETMLTEFNGT
jgi:hypothetical protein